MPDLLLRDLARITGGRLRLADLPPLHGDLEALGPIDFDLATLQPGGLYWDLGASNTAAVAECQLAFLKGATGILTEDPTVEPWSGGYALHVPNSQLALRHLSCYFKEQQGQRHVALSPGPISHTVQVALSKITCWPFSFSASPATTAGQSPGFPLSPGQPMTFVMTDFSHPLIAATLLATTPRLLIITPPSTDVFHNLSKEALHHLVEAMLPDGIILYCARPVSNAQGPQDRSLPASFQLCQAAGLPIFQLADSDQADFQLLHSNVTDRPPSLQIDGFSLPYSTTTFEARVAEAIAYVAARLLGFHATAAAARLAFPSRSSPQPGPSVLTIDPMISRAPSWPPNRHV